MSKFSENLKIIPRSAKITAVLVAVAFTILILILSQLPPSHGENPLPLAGKIILPPMGFIVLFVMILFYGFVYADAKRRGMRYVMWTLLAIFVPDAIGIILYFILRDPLPVTCPSCQTQVISKFTFCPSCGTSLKPRCPNCGQAAELAWRNCGFCGTKLPDTPAPRAA
jgi:predicted RNA-binding Zn-ribbon protein involved in translation (DUF1610 family)